MLKDYKPHLRDILASIETCQRIVAGKSFADFEGDEVVQLAVFHTLTIMGEAVGRIPEENRPAHPSINWQRMKNLRNILVHRYDEVELDTVWSVVQDKLDPLKSSVLELLKTTQGG
ncbi:DUF86 domain-containing protein [bacterium]|nr:DUF86 domain-containing protein [bacterium]